MRRRDFLRVLIGGLPMPFVAVPLPVVAVVQPRVADVFTMVPLMFDGEKIATYHIPDEPVSCAGLSDGESITLDFDGTNGLFQL